MKIPCPARQPPIRKATRPRRVQKTTLTTGEGLIKGPSLLKRGREVLRRRVLHRRRRPRQDVGGKYPDRQRPTKADRDEEAPETIEVAIGIGIVVIVGEVERLTESRLRHREKQVSAIKSGRSDENGKPAEDRITQRR